MKITVLGAGSAYGTPMLFNQWRDASPKEPKNERTRASIVIEEEGRVLLVDAGPDLRQQINRAGISDLHAVFITHAHYDHIASIPELPRAARLLGHKIDIYASAQTMKIIKESYAYLFRGEEPESVGIVWHEMPEKGEIEVAGFKLELFGVPHHHWQSSAFRVGDFAYITDWEGLDEYGAEVIKNVPLLFAECNNGMSAEKNGHSSWPEIVERIKNLNIANIVLGHLSARVDYNVFQQQLPQNVLVAFDGLVLNV